MDPRLLPTDEPHPDIRRGGELPAPAEPLTIQLTTTIERAQSELQRVPESELVLQTERLEPLDYYAAECVWSPRLLEATRGSGPENLQVWPVTLVHPLTGRTWEHFAVNVLGTTRPDTPGDLLIARDEETFALLLADPVRAAWELLGLESVTFERRSG